MSLVLFETFVSTSTLWAEGQLERSGNYTKTKVVFFEEKKMENQQ